MFVLFVVSVHIVFLCVNKLTAFEFQVLVLVVCSWDTCSVFLKSFLGNNQVVMFSLPTNKTDQLWIKIYSWLNFDADGKMLFKLCSRQAEQNGTVNTINSKFVQGSKNYQLSSIRDHDASKSHAAAKTAKEDCHKVGLSVPPRNTIKYRQVVLLQNQCSRGAIKIGKLSP